MAPPYNEPIDRDGLSDCPPFDACVVGDDDDDDDEDDDDEWGGDWTEDEAAVSDMSLIPSSSDLHHSAFSSSPPSLLDAIFMRLIEDSGTQWRIREEVR